ncbi:MAG: DUF3429 domain-containing protein [Pseudomonadota bacterium]
MFAPVPRAAAILGAAGLIPFVIGAALLLTTPGTIPTLALAPSQPQGGEFLLIRYGTIILCFMAGCQWGFLARPGRTPNATELVISVLPAIWATYVLALAETSADQLLGLIIGFLLLIPADYTFQVREIAPNWWLTLRLPLTLVVVICLSIGAF